MKPWTRSSPRSTHTGQRAARRLGVVDGMVGFSRDEAVILAGLLLFAGFSATSSVFPTLANAQNILRQAAPTIVLGLGMTLVVLVGGIDLSVGSVVIASATARPP